MFQEGIFGPKEENGTTINILHEEGNDVASIRLKALIDM